ncbi:MAG: P-loop NTPase family protein [Planctomycetota bacterium]|jgi:hypothetical protein
MYDEDHIEEVERFCTGLKEHVGFKFPIQCEECGTLYQTASDFFTHSQATDNLDGICEGYDGEHHRIVEVLRRCHCGHLLFEEFDDRRDSSPAGREIRRAFSHLLIQMREHGYDREESRKLLLEVLADRGPAGLENLKVA